MNRLILFHLILSAWALPLPAQPLRAPVAAGVPVELQGVSSDMAAASKIVVEKQWALSGDQAVSAPLADDLAFFLQQRYLQLGYREARVDWKLSGARAVLLVEEGSRQTVGRITFTGVDPGRMDSLRSYLTRQTREREGRLAKNLPFVEGDLEAGLGLGGERMGRGQARVGGYGRVVASDAVRSLLGLLFTAGAGEAGEGERLRPEAGFRRSAEIAGDVGEPGGGLKFLLVGGKRLSHFQAAHPGVDLRVSANNQVADLRHGGVVAGEHAVLVLDAAPRDAQGRLQIGRQ